MVSCCLSSADQIEVLRKLAEEVIRIRRIQETVDDLVTNPYRLYTYVIKTSVNWRRIATEINQDRNRIYHWYRETHLRNILNIKMTGDDRQAIRGIIMDGIETRSIWKEDIYGKVREKFGKKYPRQELRMTYNNIINSRGIKTILKKNGIQLFSRRNRPFTAIRGPPDITQHSADEETLRPSLLRLPGYNDNTPSAPLDDEEATAVPESPPLAQLDSAVCSTDEPRNLLVGPSLVPPFAPAPGVSSSTYPIQSVCPVSGAVPYLQTPGFINLQGNTYPFGVGIPIAYVPVLIPSLGSSGGWPWGAGGDPLGRPAGQP